MRHLWQYLENYKILSNCWLAIIVIAAAPRRWGAGELGNEEVCERGFSGTAKPSSSTWIWFCDPGFCIDDPDDPLEAQQRIQLHLSQVSLPIEVLTSTMSHLFYVTNLRIYFFPPFHCCTFYSFAVSCQFPGLLSPHPHSSFLNTSVGLLLVFCAIWRENYLEHYQSAWWSSWTKARAKNLD